MQKIKFRSVFLLFILFGSLVAILGVLKRDEIYKFLSQASGEPANLIVRVNVPLGILPRPWEHLAQGGEDLTGNMFAPVLDEAKALAPKTIRIDHLYDGYDVVKRNESGQLTFSWDRLDEVVKSIGQIGATPMLALSYMPPVISSGDIVSAPRDWNEWALVVQRTIEHYSGTLGISDISYEVWNEPDLFGGWKTYGEKNYLTLYQYSAIGASKAQGVKPFKLGGPATTAPYDAWIENFLKFVSENNLRIDFISWHRYSKDVDTFTKDWDLIRTALDRNLGVSQRLGRYMTEWGVNGDVDPMYDSQAGAAHFVAVIRSIMGYMDRVYAFELIDGKSAEGKEYWGRWGMLTHSSFGKKQKPRYEALQMMNKLSGLWIKVDGEGTWVKAIASMAPDDSIRIVVVNYDKSGGHSETTPLAVLGLPQGSYAVSKKLLGGGIKNETVDIGADGAYATELQLPVYAVMSVDLVPVKM